MDETTTAPPPPATTKKPNHSINVDFARAVLAATFETMRDCPREDPAHLHIREAMTFTALNSLGARDPIDMMFAAHAVASHHATMECFRRAMCAVDNADVASRMPRSAALMSRMMSDTVRALDARRQRISGVKTP